jgi:hypothetical protein
MEDHNTKLLRIDDIEMRRNEVGRPDPYEQVNAGAVDAMLRDSQGLAKNLVSNFPKWDANHDGYLTPAELEDVFTNKSNSTDDRTTAAASRVAYLQLANMSLPFETDNSFINDDDIEGLKTVFSPEKQQEGLLKVEKRVHDIFVNEMLPSAGHNLFKKAVLWGAYEYDRTFSLSSNYHKLVDEKHSVLNSLPEKIEEAKRNPPRPKCTSGSENFQCSLY